MKWLKSNWFLVFILIIGAFLRLYRINEYMTFLGDEGRDVIIVRNLLVKLDPILIGPGTSVGSMYLGPLYYYFMAPFLLLFNFSPVGPAVGVALLGIATIYLVYKVTFEWFGKIAGLIAAGLYSISPTVIIFSHSSWNPNIMPFFALLSVYAIWKVYESNDASREMGRWLMICAVSFAFVLQSHYLGVLLAPVLFIYWFLAFKKNKLNKSFLLKTLLSIGAFSILMSPLLIFDIRHDWMNSKALYKFLSVRDDTVSIKPWTAIPKIYPIFEHINLSLLAAKYESVAKIITATLVAFIAYLLILRKKIIKYPAFYILVTWLAFGLFGFGIYKQNIYDHYFGFMFPIPFILTGILLSKIYDTKYKLLSISLLSILIFINLSKSPILKEPNNLLRRSNDVANKVISESKGNEFNIAVIADQNYEDGYQYFLEKNNSKIVEIDSQKPETVTKQLFVICEKVKENCDPTHSSKAEVANFGWSKIEANWEIDGVIIYKLIHTK